MIGRLRTSQGQEARAHSPTGRIVARPDGGSLRRDTPAPDGRIPELDAVRGIACMAILLYHVKPHKFPGGWAAVDVFLILSGYLITSIILRHHGRPGFLRTFYVRRGLRIWPVYYLAVLAIALASPLLPKACDFAGFGYILTYTQNLPLLWGGHAPHFSTYLTHTWSLAVEEQFYLIWPALVCLVGRRGIVPLSLATLGMSVAARACGLDWWLLVARADGFALGSLLAGLMLDRAPGDPGGRRLDALFVATGLAGLAWIVPMVCTIGLGAYGPPSYAAPTLLAINLAAFGAVGLVVRHAGSPRLAILRRPRLCYVGTISYGLYMYHYIVLVLVDDAAKAHGMGGRPFWRDLLCLVAITALAMLSWRFVERPILSLKDRFAYPAGGPPAPGRTRSRAATRVGPRGGS